MTAQPNTTPSFNVFEFYNLVIQQAQKRYNLSLEESLELRSTFFYTLLEARIQNDAVEYNSLKFDSIFIKEHTKKCVKSFNENTHRNISHQFLISKFRNRLAMRKGQKDIVFELKEFDIILDKAEQSTKKISDNKLFKENAFHILEIFEDTIIPIELYVVLICEINLIHDKNKEFFNTCSKYSIVNFTTEIVLGQIKTIGKRITTKDGMYSCLTTPPDKDNFTFNFWANTFDPTSSLKPLTFLFGDSKWYQQFQNYNKHNEEMYFSFSEEPFFKLETDKRTFKKVTLLADISDFLSDTNQKYFFNVWETRLIKKEKEFFQEFIKPKIFENSKEIEITTDESNKDEIKDILKGIQNTSCFQFKTENIFGSVNIITSISSLDNKITLSVNESLYKDEGLDTQINRTIHV